METNAFIAGTFFLVLSFVSSLAFSKPYEEQIEIERDKIFANVVLACIVAVLIIGSFFPGGPLAEWAPRILLIALCVLLGLIAGKLVANRGRQL